MKSVIRSPTRPIVKVLTMSRAGSDPRGTTYENVVTWMAEMLGVLVLPKTDTRSALITLRATFVSSS